jgi:hypothetical protein
MDLIICIWEDLGKTLSESFFVGSLCIVNANTMGRINRLKSLGGSMVDRF